MKYLSLAIVPFMVGLLIPLVMSAIKKSNLKKESNMNKDEFIICSSIKWAWFMITLAIVTATILILLNFFDGSNLPANIIVPILIIFFLFGSFACVREKIIVKENTITVTLTFAKTKVYTFEDIKKIREVAWSNGMQSYCVYNETKKIFSIYDTMPGFNLFIQKIVENNIHIERLQKQKQSKKK